MKQLQHQQSGHYEYQVFVNSTETGHYQGVIVVTGYNGESYEPSIQIPTPTLFKTSHAAEIEASAMAVYLIHTGSITALLSHAESGNPLTTLQPGQLKVVDNG